MHPPQSAGARFFVTSLSGFFQTLFELINTPAGINEFLFAGKERMALGADFNRHITFGGTGLHRFAASALDRGFFILGMNSSFHDHTSSRCIHIIHYITTAFFKLQVFFYVFLGFLRFFQSDGCFCRQIYLAISLFIWEMIFFSRRDI